MSALLNVFLQLQFLVAVVAVLALLLRLAARKAALPLSARAELKLHYLLFGFCLAGLLLPSGAEEFRFAPVARVLEIPGARSVAGASGLSASGNLHLYLGENLNAAPSVALSSIGILASVLVLLGFLLVGRDYWRLYSALRRCTVFRAVGRVRLAVCEGEGTPFSVLGLRSAWVVVPSSLLGHPSLRIAVAHELQHHRSGDTLWCQLFSAVRAPCFFHPLLRVWGSTVAEAQELACDEALVCSQKKWISARKYSECLLHAAETAGKGKKAVRSYAAAPALFSERRLLKRRIESMFAKKVNRNSMVVALGLVLAGGMAASAAASQQWLVDSRITMAEAERMASVAQRGSEFPVAVNDRVLRYLNYYLGTVKGREFTRSALARLEALRPKLEAKLALHGAPEELLAVGLTESGFQNLPSSANKTTGAAGIWQFIASTARVFGMRVDAQVDERLDIDVESDAAFRYLTANKLRFNDWLLGVMAYNMGERALDSAIRKAGTRDPWELVKRGYENDTDYLPKFMAAVLILKNPQALK